MSKKIDVLIVGAGFVGLWSAIVLSKQGLSVVVVDSRSWGVLESHVSSNIFALTDYVYGALSDYGVNVKADPVVYMKVGTVKHFPALSFGKSCQSHPLAWTVSSAELWAALVDRFKRDKIDLRTEFDPKHCLLSDDNVQLLDKHGVVFEAEVVLAADGTNSWLRNYWDITCTRKNQILPSKTVVFPIKWESQDPVTARQWFGSDFGVVAFLPYKYSNSEFSACCVWSLPAGHLLWQKDKPEWCSALCEFLNIDKSSLIASEDVCCYDIEEYITPIVERRCVLMGSAAYSVHPLAGQGLNIGFRCLLRLSEIWEKRPSFRSISDPSILRAYGREVELEVRKWMFLTNVLWRTSSNSICLGLLSRGMLLTDKCAFAKNWFVRCAQ